jgi:hypothetical protein
MRNRKAIIHILKAASLLMADGAIEMKKRYVNVKDPLLEQMDVDTTQEGGIPKNKTQKSTPTNNRKDLKTKDPGVRGKVELIDSVKFVRTKDGPKSPTRIKTT